ncbi:MAG: ATP-binding cassette domain-containing protein, partial [Planctomycetia bacterium]|nr:ATP-binding cassette domain-containing protein [Planctomycetia bacterium]
MIQIRHLSVRLGNFRLDDVNFDVDEGAYAVLMGRTGAGKTTLQEC